MADMGGYTGPNLSGTPFASLGRKLRSQQTADQGYYNQYVNTAKASLPRLFAPAYGAISQQFAPQFQQAHNYLSANPALANSGAGSALNRQLLQGAYGQLGQAMTGATADTYKGGLDLLGQLIAQRQNARLQQEQQKKKGFNPLGAVGAGLSLIPGVGGAASKLWSAATQ